MCSGVELKLHWYVSMLILLYTAYVCLLFTMKELNSSSQECELQKSKNISFLAPYGKEVYKNVCGS